MFEKTKTIQIEIPKNLYSSLIDLFFSAVRMTNIREKDEDFYNWVQHTIGEAFKTGKVLAVDGKIINKTDLEK